MENSKRVVNLARWYYNKEILFIAFIKMVHNTQYDVFKALNYFMKINVGKNCLYKITSYIYRQPNRPFEKNH